MELRLSPAVDYLNQPKEGKRRDSGGEMVHQLNKLFVCGYRL